MWSLRTAYPDLSLIINFFLFQAFKNQLCKEQQDKRFEQEKAVLIKNYENELQSMVDQQNKQVKNHNCYTESLYRLFRGCAYGKVVR